MKVQIEIRNKNLELINIKELDFDEFCDLLSRKINSILYLIEPYFNSNNKENQFKDVRNNILDVSGQIKRLPTTIIFEKEN